MMIDIQRHQQQVEEAVTYLRSILTDIPEIVIQLGTGLGNLADALDEGTTIGYKSIPNFPASTVESHAGNLVCGMLRGRRVAILQGRFHCYEGYSAQEVGFPIRVLSLLGAGTAIITNASGGLNPAFTPGMIMVMADHINLLGDNPLRGPNVESWGDRFPDLSCPYDPTLRQLVLKVGAEMDVELTSGTYIGIPGPSLETPAETRMLRLLGGDAVGMSSIPEILTAIHAGMRVLGLSVIANVNDPDRMEPILLDEIVAAAGRAEPRLQQLVLQILPEV